MRGVGRVGVTILACTSILACAPGKSTSDGAATTGATDTTHTDATSTETGATTEEPGTTSDGTSDEASSGSDTEGGVFIGEPDGGDSDLECDVWSDDCPPGEKCMPWANDGGASCNATKCSPIAPDPKQPGDECTVEENGVGGVDDCDAASMCWDIDPETKMGYCVSFCVGSGEAPTCVDPWAACAFYDGGMVPLCLPGCDPLLPDCPNDRLCVPASSSEGFICVSNAGEGQYQDPCEHVNVCDHGLFCANADAVPGCVGGVGCCAHHCNLITGDPGCPDTDLGVECVPWFDDGPAPPGYEHVGACVLP